MIAQALANLFRPRAAAEGKLPGMLDDFWYHPVGETSIAGVDVRPDNAMRNSTVFACVRLRAETIASLPWHVYERRPDGTKRDATDYQLWDVLHKRPNAWQTSMEWRETGQQHLDIRGNFYNRILPGPRGAIDQLIPLNPDRMKVRAGPAGSVLYDYKPMGEPQITYAQEEIFHVRGPSLNGLTGLSTLEYARNAVGLALAEETHGASYFRNGALPAFWIKRPPGVPWTDEKRANFRAGWRKLHGGPENAGNPPIIEDGMTLESLGINNKESQWLEGKQAQAVEICRFFRIPPHLVGILDKPTYASIEMMSIEFVVYTMLPICRRWESRADCDLVIEPKYYTKLALQGLLRGDLKSRYEAYNIAIQCGMMVVNEARALEDMDPIEGGDVPYRPLNMGPAAATGGGRRVASTVAAWIDDAAERLAAAEVRGLEARAVKASSDPTRWTAFLADFYARHATYATKTLDRLVAACRAVGRGCPDASVLGSQLAEWGAVAMREGDPELLTEAWSKTRQGQVREFLRRGMGLAKSGKRNKEPPT